MLISQVGKNRAINAIFGKEPSVLGHAELLEPIRNLLHRRPPTDLMLSVLEQDKWSTTRANLLCLVKP